MHSAVLFEPIWLFTFTAKLLNTHILPLLDQTNKCVSCLYVIQGSSFYQIIVHLLILLYSHTSKSYATKIDSNKNVTLCLQIKFPPNVAFKT